MVRIIVPASAGTISERTARSQRISQQVEIIGVDPQRQVLIIRTITERGTRGEVLLSPQDVTFLEPTAAGILEIQSRLEARQAEILTQRTLESQLRAVREGRIDISEVQAGFRPEIERQLAVQVEGVIERPVPVAAAPPRPLPIPIPIPSPLPPDLRGLPFERLTAAQQRERIRQFERETAELPLVLRPPPTFAAPRAISPAAPLQVLQIARETERKRLERDTSLIRGELRPIFAARTFEDVRLEAGAPLGRAIIRQAGIVERRRLPSGEIVERIARPVTPAQEVARQRRLAKERQVTRELLREPLSIPAQFVLREIPELFPAAQITIGTFVRGVATGEFGLEASQGLREIQAERERFARSQVEAAREIQAGRATLLRTSLAQAIPPAVTVGVAAVAPTVIKAIPRAGIAAQIAIVGAATADIVTAAGAPTRRAIGRAVLTGGFAAAVVAPRAFAAVQPTIRAAALRLPPRVFTRLPAAIRPIKVRELFGLKIRGAAEIVGGRRAFPRLTAREIQAVTTERFKLQTRLTSRQVQTLLRESRAVFRVGEIERAGLFARRTILAEIEPISRTFFVARPPPAAPRVIRFGGAGGLIRTRGLSLQTGSFQRGRFIAGALFPTKPPPLPPQPVGRIVGGVPPRRPIVITPRIPRAPTPPRIFAPRPTFISGALQLPSTSQQLAAIAGTTVQIRPTAAGIQALPRDITTIIFGTPPTLRAPTPITIPFLVPTVRVTPFRLAEPRFTFSAFQSQSRRFRQTLGIAPALLPRIAPRIDIGSLIRGRAIPRVTRIPALLPITIPITVPVITPVLRPPPTIIKIPTPPPVIIRPPPPFIPFRFPEFRPPKIRPIRLPIAIPAIPRRFQPSLRAIRRGIFSTTLPSELSQAIGIRPITPAFGRPPRRKPKVKPKKKPKKKKKR